MLNKKIMGILAVSILFAACGKQAETKKETNIAETQATATETNSNEASVTAETTVPDQAENPVGILINEDVLVEEGSVENAEGLERVTVE